MMRFPGVGPSANPEQSGVIRLRGGGEGREIGGEDINKSDKAGEDKIKMEANVS